MSTPAVPPSPGDQAPGLPLVDRSTAVHLTHVRRLAETAALAGNRDFAGNINFCLDCPRLLAYCCRMLRKLPAFGVVALSVVGLVLQPSIAQGQARAGLQEPSRPAHTAIDDIWHDLRLDEFSAIMRQVPGSPQPDALGGPRSGLSWRGLIDFYDGKAAFEYKFTAATGLGPVYNDVSCGSCHRAPVIGGGGRDMRDGILVHGPPETDGDAMGVRKSAIEGHTKERAQGPTARLRTPPLFGFGELDAISDSAIDANVDSTDANRDGIRGVRGQRYGGNGKRGSTRFGQKANEWNLRRFVAGALFDEMGVSSTVRRNPVGDRDAVPDPEVPSTFIDRLDSYVRNLARPPRGPVTADSKKGAQLFDNLGCTGCHRPSLGSVTGAYTDLLLHDMGKALDSGIKDGVATGRMWRTMPLWGVRFRKAFLHDERVRSYDKVLEQHDGEAARPARAYGALPPQSRALIAAFLNSL
jgi:CxxC motif-containing protein (DUF1111 family)